MILRARACTCVHALIVEGLKSNITPSTPGVAPSHVQARWHAPSSGLPPAGLSFKFAAAAGGAGGRTECHSGGAPWAIGRQAGPGPAPCSPGA